MRCFVFLIQASKPRCRTSHHYVVFSLNALNIILTDTVTMENSVSSDSFQVTLKVSTKYIETTRISVDVLMTLISAQYSAS